MNMAICWLSAAGGSQNFANYKKAKIDLLHILVSFSNPLAPGSGLANKTTVHSQI